MRILLIDHGPLVANGAESLTAALAQRLVAAGYDAHVLTVDVAPAPMDDVSVRCVVCRPNDRSADLPFLAPSFVAGQDGRPTFAELSDAQLAAYREALRRALDEEVTAFNPQVIHCQHVWVGGHLALETGVPYVLSARAEELVLLADDSRYLRFVQEAAENAGRILVNSDALREKLLAACGEPEDLAPRVLVVGESLPIEQLVAIYQRVIDERSGSTMR